MRDSVFQLKCQCNNYPWGKKGSASLAAQLCSKTLSAGFKIDESKNYAEMWLGTYPELPARILSTGEDLQDVLNRYECLIGSSVYEKFGSELPFLPKVLSIQKALPLQLHPNRALAEELHKKDPSNFTDPNHKPEIAIALGPFEAFVGFKPLTTIAQLMELEPLQQFLPEIKKPRFDDPMLKHVVNAILKASDTTISNVVRALEGSREDKFGPDGHYIPKMAKRLRGQYDQTDPGIVVALVTMNYMQLNAGDCIYIPADGIHAYLSGDIIECMARSNNVLNTGFCPAADRNNADLFTDALTFTVHDTEEAILKSKDFERCTKGKTKVYSPPLSEFDVLKTELEKGEEELISALRGPAIAIVTKGTGLMTTKREDYTDPDADKTPERSFRLQEGFVFFIGFNNIIRLETQTSLELFIAFAE
ncbi:mannose-6-phosphate isomeras-like protein [Rhizodiscina lignyota]|uniref:Mannose-6-phosphate isomerase n=1 Tax=Rhizodiscina lignyota TaxID=1504668 RepID=A0A9P4M391_9PEZI|nr:mannose-6-phosphate isomeras-like protein [Rhizodiscina lignyota]